MALDAKLAVTAVLLLAQPATGSAQNMRPLSELMKDGAESSFPSIGCAGFYLSMLEWAGEDVLGPESSQTVKLTVHNLMEAAVSVRAEASGTSEQHPRELAFRDVRNVSDLYLMRYENSYAEMGQAWGTDTLWADDQAVCGILTSGEGQ